MFYRAHCGYHDWRGDALASTRSRENSAKWRVLAHSGTGHRHRYRYRYGFRGGSLKNGGGLKLYPDVSLCILMYPACILQNTASCTYPVYPVRILCEPLYSAHWHAHTHARQLAHAWFQLRPQRQRQSTAWQPTVRTEGSRTYRQRRGGEVDVSYGIFLFFGTLCVLCESDSRFSRSVVE